MDAFIKQYQGSEMAKKKKSKGKMRSPAMHANPPPGLAKAYPGVSTPKKGKRAKSILSY